MEEKEKEKLIIRLLIEFAVYFIFLFAIFLSAINRYTELPSIFAVIASFVCTLSGIVKTDQTSINRLMELLVFKKSATYKSSDKFKEYTRTLPNDYGPAVVSLLLDYELEYDKDIAATILNLHAKKYIDIQINGKFENIIIINNDVSKLLSHEKYIFECIEQKTKIDNNRFEHCVRKDSYSLGLLKDGQAFYRKHLITFLVLLLIFITICILPYFYTDSLILLFVESNNNIFIYGSIIVFLKIIVVMLLFGYIRYLSKIRTKKYTRSSIGKTQANLWLQLKDFLTDFSQLNKANLTQLEIWNSYLAYALGLGIIEKESDFTKINPGIKFNYSNINFKNLE